MLQRKQRIAAMISKRRSNLQYLKKFHEGEHYWMNIVLMTKFDLDEYVKKHIKTPRILGYFYLGVSFSKLYDNTIGCSASDPLHKAEYVTLFIKGITQLIEEFEYHLLSSTMQSVKYVMAKSVPCVYPNISSPDNDIESTEVENAVIKSTLYKYQSDIVYEYLLVPHLPFEDHLNYLEIFISLCNILLRIYESFQDMTCFK